MTKSIISADRSPITLAASFLGAFIVGSLAVQLVRSQTATMSTGIAAVEPVIAGPAALWAPLAESDIASLNKGSSSEPAAAIQPAVDPVVGSEATLWAPFGER